MAGEKFKESDLVYHKSKCPYLLLIVSSDARSGQLGCVFFDRENNQFDQKEFWPSELQLAVNEPPFIPETYKEGDIVAPRVYKQLKMVVARAEGNEYICTFWLNNEFKTLRFGSDELTSQYAGS